MATGLAGTGVPGTGQPCADWLAGTGADGRGVGDRCGERRCVPGREAERRPGDLERDFAAPRQAASSTSRMMTRTSTSAIPTPMIMRCNSSNPADAPPRASGKPDTKH